MSPSSSKRVVAIIVVFAIIIAIPLFLLVGRKKPPADKVTRMALMSMTSDLQGLIMAEAATRQIRGRYVADPEAAGAMSSPGVTPAVITLSDTGWSAVVHHKSIPGIRCAVAVYNRNPIKRFAKSGEIVCE